ncbi:MAG: hypothetical protein F4Y35_09790 [Chloroflexi bacterium]|nr:hypothetical protein [Chloroflexota bacterium]
MRERRAGPTAHAQPAPARRAGSPRPRTSHPAARRSTGLARPRRAPAPGLAARPPPRLERHHRPRDPRPRIDGRPIGARRTPRNGRSANRPRRSRRSRHGRCCRSPGGPAPRTRRVLESSGIAGG